MSSLTSISSAQSGITAYPHPETGAIEGIQGERVWELVPYHPSFFGRFPEYGIRLSELPQKIEAYRSNPGVLYTLFETMKQMSQMDSSLPRRTEEHQRFSFIHTPALDFLLSPVPKKTDVAPYIRECIERRIGVLVSAHEQKDANPRECGKFWDQTVLSRLDLGGWSIEVKEMNTTLQGTKENCKGQIPAIEVTFLHATHRQKPSHTMVHLYITGWVDRTVASDENLVLTLLKLMQLFSSGPVAVNCAAGRGRSLTIGLVCAQIRQIYETWVHGGDIENMVINVPELVYHISQQRDLDLRNTSVERVCPVFLQMLSLTNAYAQCLLTGKFS